MRRFVFLSFLLLGSGSLSAQNQVEWLNAEELQLKYVAEPKPVLIFLETSWCKICKMQVNTTFDNDSVIQYLKKGYYAFKMNAEQKDSIQFFGRTYTYNAAERFHDLALYFGKNEGQIQFPTTVFLNNRLQLLVRKPALVNTEEMLQILRNKDTK